MPRFFSSKPVPRRTRFAGLLLLSAFLLFTLLCTANTIIQDVSFFSAEDSRFTDFTEQVFRSELSGSTLNLHYTIAQPSSYGLEHLPVTLGNGSLKARQQSIAVLENYQNALERFDYEQLSTDNQLTYDVFHHYLETELKGAPFLLYDEPLSPSLGIQAQLPVLLAEYTFRTKGDIEDYLCLLTQIPDYFSSLLAFERDKAEAGLFMSSEQALEVIRQCQDFIRSKDNYLVTIFNEKIDAISNLSADEKAAYQSRNQSILTGYVIPAYETLCSGLAALEENSANDKGLYWLPDGKAYYQYLVQSMVGDDRNIEEIEEAVKTQIVHDFEQIRALTDSAGQTDEVRQTAASLSQPAADQSERYLLELRSKITRDFPLAPDVFCKVRLVHDSLQEHLSPAFYLTPAIDDYERNVIYINPASDYNDLELFATLAHEGYPGHLYQSVFFHSQTPNLLRHLLDTGGYTEGWATYVEMYACSLWDDDPVQASLYQHNRSFTLGLASLLDIGIHYHGYSLADTEAFLKQLGFDSSTARSMYQSILQSPANYLQYYVGYLNFLDLRSLAEKQAGSSFSLKEFHRFVLETGPAPFSILRDRLTASF